MCAASKGIPAAVTLAELLLALVEDSWAVVQRTDMYVCVLSLRVGFLGGVIKQTVSAIEHWGENPFQA